MNNHDQSTNLRVEVERASRRYEEAKRDFWRISVEVPSGIPAPDGSLRIQNAARAQTIAMDALAEAIKRFNDYLINESIAKREHGAA